MGDRGKMERPLWRFTRIKIRSERKEIMMGLENGTELDSLETD